MNELHVGRGTTRGGLTVFPVWSAGSGVARYTTDTRHLDVTECEDGPEVPTLMVGNTGDRPLLVLEGQLFEGGWQHRMATRSVLVGFTSGCPWRWPASSTAAGAGLSGRPVADGGQRRLSGMRCEPP